MAGARAHGRLVAGAARAELDPGENGDGGHEQPRGEQKVDGEAEDGQADEDGKGKGDDR